MPPSAPSGIRLSICQEDDVPEMARLLAETFTQRDPPAVAVALTADEFEAFVRVVAASPRSQQLTIIAQDTASGAMAGALLAEDPVSPAREGMERLSPKFDAIFGLFDQLDERTGATGSTPPEASLHLFLLGVSSEYMGRGIAQQLVTACLARGSEMGYRWAITEATNTVSQHIFEKLGFATRAVASYAEYRHDGIAMFASIAAQGGPKAMIREIPKAG